MTNSALISVDFIRADGTPIPGLVAVEEGKRDRTPLSVDEQASILDAGSFDRIDYIFFRRFSDGRSSQVAAYVVDNSNEPLDENALIKLHTQVWLQGRAPLLYIAWPTRIDVLACAREPDFWQEEKKDRRYNPAETLSVAGNIAKEMQRFSAFRLADGTFWDEPRNRKLANYDKAAHQALIQAVVETDRELDGENNPLFRRLLLLMILIKYLEDRDVFPNQGWFGRFHKGAKNFFDILKNGNPDEVYDLLGFLERKFNGEVFNLSRLEIKRLTKNNLNKFARFVETRTLDRQRYLWDQFSFEHLPVEIISHLYQRFVQGGHGAVYTPPFLASLLLDQAMPYDTLTGKERVLDPACGSGVFLVGAFRRLINVWRNRNNWKKPDVDTLKKILRKSIFGVELDPFAVDLTAFSLSLALCDALPTIDIWGKLKFDRLRESNLFEADFFQLLLDSQEDKSHFINKGFDVVIGNPPFESELTPAGKKVQQNEQQQDPSRGKLPDKQVAYLFLEQSFNLLHPEKGRICLIQPSSLLYYQNPRSFFINRILKRYCVNTVLDFTSIRKLYKKADTKTIAIHAYAKPPENDRWINHWTFRRAISTHERISFELDHYDCQRVPQDQAENDQFIWRLNLFGGGRLHEISKRFRHMCTLKQYCKRNNWDYGEGFNIGNRRNPAPFLTGRNFLPTKAFTSVGIDQKKIETVTETHFEVPRKKEQFTPPLVLIKESDFLPIAYWDKFYLTYRHEIVGIHAPRPDETDLKNLHDLLVNRQDFYRFMVTIHGSRSFVAKSTAILKRDIDLLPIPEKPSSLDLSFWEKAIQNDVLKYMAAYIRRGQNSELLRKKANGKELETYAKMFCRMLGSVYDNLRASNPIFLNSLICQPFYFGEKPKLEWLDEDAEEPLKKLIYYDNHEHLRTVRVFRYYAENVMLIVKPNRLRYWIRSTAIRDADETLKDLYQQGY